MTRFRFALTSALAVTLFGSFALVSPAGAAPEEKKAEAPKADVKTKEVKIDDIALAVPENWKETEPTSKFRKAQFEVPKVEGDNEPAELVVFYFDGSGGGVDANVKRWIGQFQSNGREVKTAEGTSKQGTYAIADVTGTYNQPIGPPIRQQTKAMPGARMLGVVLEVKGKGNYFLKLTGPEKTVTAAAEAFRASFGADPKSEKELKLGE